VTLSIHNFTTLLKSHPYLKNFVTSGCDDTLKKCNEKKDYNELFVKYNEEYMLKSQVSKFCALEGAKVLEELKKINAAVIEKYGIVDEDATPDTAKVVSKVVAPKAVETPAEPVVETPAEPVEADTTKKDNKAKKLPTKQAKKTVVVKAKGKAKELEQVKPAEPVVEPVVEPVAAENLVVEPVDEPVADPVKKSTKKVAVKKVAPKKNQSNLSKRTLVKNQSQN